jgi:hypothetical protein
MAAASRLHSTKCSTSLTGPASLGWNVANLGVDTVELQLGESLATPGSCHNFFNLEGWVN